MVCPILKRAGIWIITLKSYYFKLSYDAFDSSLCASVHRNPGVLVGGIPRVCSSAFRFFSQSFFFSSWSLVPVIRAPSI